MGKKRSGSVEFEFDIERYKNIETDEYFTFEELSPEDRDNEELYSYNVITLNVSGNGYFTPGKYHGPWEDSYPDDGECEIESAIDADDKNWHSSLTSSEVSSIEEKLMDKIMDLDDGPDYDDRDYDYDDRYDYYY